MTKRSLQKTSIGRRWRRVIAAGLAGMLWGGGGAGAQEDPFGGAPGGGAPSRPTTAAPKPAQDESGLNDPAVLAILASKPTQPDEFARAIRNLIDLGHPALAKRYVVGLENTNPSLQVWAELQDRFGTEFFLRLSREQQLQPEGARVSRTALTAAQTLARDPANLIQLINQFSSADIAVRRQALVALRQIGTPAVAPLISALSEPARAPQYRRIQAALAEIGELAIEPMIGVLESDDTALRVRIIEVLGEIRARRALGYLVRPSLEEESPELQAAARQALRQLIDSNPTRREALHFLRRRVADLLAGSTPIRLDHEDSGELWHWSSVAKVPVARRYALHKLCTIEAARLARELYILDPDQPDSRRLYLAADLEAAKLIVGLDQPLPRDPGSSLSRARAMGPEVIEDLLTEMVKANRPLAAACAAEVLGEIGGTSLVESDNGRPRPLVLAANHADRRVRFAAVEAILKIDPREPYAGSNYVSESLGFLAGSVGSRRVLVAHPNLEEAQSLVGLLADMGWDADNATTGRSVFLQATRQPDYEYILLTDTLSAPTTRELLQQLRREKRTASLTVGILVQQTPFTIPPASRKESTSRSALTGDANDVRKPAAESDDDPINSKAKDDPIAKSFSAVGPGKRNPIYESLAVRRESSYIDHTPTPVDPLIKARQWTFGDERTAVFARPFDLDGMENVLRRLKTTAGRSIVPRDQRVAQAVLALEAIAKLAEAEPRYGFYELLRLERAVETAFQTPDLTVPAARALGLLGTPKAQLALVDLASQQGRPLEDRQAAVEGFRLAVQRRSLLLTRVDLLRQYDRYNQSERLDRGTQLVLGAVLDIIESRGAPDPARVPAATPTTATPTTSDPTSTPHHAAAPE